MRIKESVKRNIENAYQGALVVKNLPDNAEDRFDPWVGKIPWRRKWLPTPVFSPGESQRENPGRLQSIGLHSVGHALSDLACIYKMPSKL